MKNMNVVEIINNMTNELEEAKKEYRFFKMLQLFPEFDKETPFGNNFYNFECWAKEADERMCRIRKERSVFKNLAHRYR